jgi:hypothetical protein
VHGAPDREAVLVVAVWPQIAGCNAERRPDDSLGARVRPMERARDSVARQAMFLGELGEIRPA